MNMNEDFSKTLYSSKVENTLKLFSIVLFVISIIGCLLMMSLPDIGVILGIVSFLFSTVFCLCLYAFGELLSVLKQIRNTLQSQIENDYSELPKI